MKIKLITIGQKMSDWIQMGIHHYQQQLPNTFDFKLITLAAQKHKHTILKKIKSQRVNYSYKLLKPDNYAG